MRRSRSLFFGRTCCHCCCCCNSGNDNGRTARNTIETICYCSRYLDVPMRIYHGAGYTKLDCCTDTRETLREISDTLADLSDDRSGSSCCNRCCC